MRCTLLAPAGVNWHMEYIYPACRACPAQTAPTSCMLHMNQPRLMLLVALSCYSLGAAAQTAAPQFPVLSKTLDSLFATAQEPVRELARRTTLSGRAQKQQAPRDFGAEQLAIAARHQPLLQAIVRKYGYPGVQQVGENSARNFALLVQQADFKHFRFQRQVLRLLRVEVVRRNASSEDYEYLADRVAQNIRLHRSRVAEVPNAPRRPGTTAQDPADTYANWENSKHQQQMTAPPYNNSSAIPAFGTP